MGYQAPYEELSCKLKFIKAEFTILGTTGRHVKWKLPPVKSITADNDNIGLEKVDCKSIHEDSYAEKDALAHHDCMWNLYRISQRLYSSLLNNAK